MIHLPKAIKEHSRVSEIVLQLKDASIFQSEILVLSDVNKEVGRKLL